MRVRLPPLPHFIVCERCGDIAMPAQGVKKVRFCSKSCAARARSPHLGFAFDQGRWFVTCRDGSRTAWARVVMERHIGRPLRSAEVVHHRNEDPTDDRIENLQLTDRAEHMRLHHGTLVAARWPA